MRAVRDRLMLGLNRARLLFRLPQLFVCVLQFDRELKHRRVQALLLFYYMRAEAALRCGELCFMGG